MSLPKAKLYASESEVQKSWVEWSKFRTCSRCGQTFNWLNSFGSWECSQHLGGLSYKYVNDKHGMSHREYRYWNCCKQKDYPKHAALNENIWKSYRQTVANNDLNICTPRIPGCIPCDHTEGNDILDDGIRLDMYIISSDYSFAPFGGHKINDTVKYKNQKYIVENVYFDKSVDLQDFDEKRIPAERLQWPDAEFKMELGRYYNWNTRGKVTPIKVLNSKLIDINAERKYKIDFIIMDIGMPVHDIAAMIPHMTGDPTKRPGWKFDVVDGKTMFPNIKSVSARPPYNK